MDAIFDERWRLRALAGDTRAVRQLADQALRPLYAFCLYRVGRDAHLCEEVVQETLVQAMSRLNGYEPGRSGNQVFAWLTGLARNEIRRVLRREHRGASLDELWARMDRELLAVYARLDSERFGEDVLEREETREMVNATMSQIPPHYRRVLEAKYVDGCSTRDLAHWADISEKAAESLLGRARKAFRATFLTLTGGLGPGGAT